MIPTTEAAKRISALFNRRLTTHWSPREVAKFKQLSKFGCFQTLDDLKMVEEYYKAERAKDSDGHHRHDLYTFLFNYNGEVDRARARHTRIQGIKNKSPVLPRPPELTDEQIEKNKEFIKKQIEVLRERFKMPKLKFQMEPEVPPVVKDAMTMFNATLAK